MENTMTGMMNFGAPRRRENTVNTEKYPTTPVVTISEFKGKGTGRKITLNPAAIAALSINFEKDALISFSFDVFAGTVLIANTSGLENMSGVRLAATSKSISDKAYFESIKKQFNVKSEDACELLMTKGADQFNGIDTYFLSLITAVDQITSTVTEAIVESFGDVNEAPIEEIIKQAEEREEFLASGEEVLDGEEVLVEGIEVESEEVVLVEAEAEFAISNSTQEEKNFFDGFDN
jgi:hypothetical protein